MNAFVHHPRGIPASERARIFAEADGRCAGCTRKIGAGEDWDLDHRIPLACGGSNEASNMQVLCPFCHSAKTSDDVSDAAKIKRVATTHSVPRRFRPSRWPKRFG